MADMLKKYEEVTDEVTAPTTASDRSAERLRRIELHEQKVLKRMKRLLKEQKRLKKREAKRRKAEKEAAKKAEAEKAAAEKDNKGKNGNGDKSFLSKLGKAICDAIPKVLTTLTALAFGFFVKRKLSLKSLFA